MTASHARFPLLALGIAALFSGVSGRACCAPDWSLPRAQPNLDRACKAACVL